MANIALVEDHVVLRHGLSILIQELGNKVFFEADNGKDCIEKLKTHSRPDVIIMDASMPVMDGYDTTLYLKNHYPEIKVLALSMIDEETSVIRMLKNGARGYILKNCSPVQLSDAIYALMNNGYYHSDQVSGKLIRAINNYDDSNSGMRNVFSISEKEVEFLRFAATELTYKEIASKMNVSPRTVDSYRENLFLKLSVNSRVGLAVYAIKNGFVVL
jgi:DNA-binding NarL/FixJ family response regulator